MTETESEESAPRDLFTVEQFSARRQAWTQQALRNLILNSSDRLNSRGERIHGNGLAEAGALVRVGRRVLIDEQAFFRWIAEQQKRANRPSAAHTVQAKERPDSEARQCEARSARRNGT